MSPRAMNRPTAKSSESPGRIGKSRPHSMKTIATLTQKKLLSEAVEEPLGVHPVRSEGRHHAVKGMRCGAGAPPALR